uniref:Glycosyl transferase CAP10 domain-containing protein n=1 Tax=viral metagenome TaxID=1070528 RepID=A0A6C0JYF1_9ZZZZ
MKKLRAYSDALEYLKPYASEKELQYPFSFSIQALETTLRYIIDLSYNCYILIGDTRELLKFEFATTSPLLKKHLTQKNSLSSSKRKTLKHKQWRIMQCVVKPFGVSEDDLFPRFLKSLSVPSGLFVLSLSDSNLLRKDFGEPYFGVSTRYTPPFLPMFAYSGHQDYWDIPIPTYDDIHFAMNPFEVKQIPWSEKQSKAVFRGGITGCGVTPETNQRIHLATKRNDLLDVGLVETSSKHLRFDPRHGLSELKAHVHKVPKLPMFTEQIKYKYILHVDGNVFAYRWLSSFLTGSLILRVKSRYVHWTDTFFKDGKHYISIAADLSDLNEKVNWCLHNDAACKRIAERSRKLAQMYLEKSFIESYFLRSLQRL